MNQTGMMDKPLINQGVIELVQVLDFDPAPGTPVDLFRFDDISPGNEHFKFAFIFLQAAEGDNARLELKFSGAHRTVDA